jgi:hypothetical protein
MAASLSHAQQQIPCSELLPHAVSGHHFFTCAGSPSPTPCGGSTADVSLGAQLLGADPYMTEHLHGWRSPFLGAPWLLVQVPYSTSHSACSSPTRSLPWRPLLPAMAPRKIPQPSPQEAPSLLHGRARPCLHRRRPLGTRDLLPLYPIPSPTPHFISDLWHTAAAAMASIFFSTQRRRSKRQQPRTPSVSLACHPLDVLRSHIVAARCPTTRSPSIFPRLRSSPAVSARLAALCCAVNSTPGCPPGVCCFA